MTQLKIDGQVVRARDGETVAAVLVRSGQWVFGNNPVSGEPRGAYCGMGVCFECEVEVDGRIARACLLEVRDGISIKTRRVDRGKT